MLQHACPSLLNEGTYRSNTWAVLDVLPARDTGLEFLTGQPKLADRYQDLAFLQKSGICMGQVTDQ